MFPYFSSKEILENSIEQIESKVAQVDSLKKQITVNEKSLKALQSLIQRWLKESSGLQQFYLEFQSKSHILFPKTSPFSSIGKIIAQGFEEMEEIYSKQSILLNFYLQNSQSWFRGLAEVEYDLKDFDCFRKKFIHYQHKVEKLLKTREQATTGSQLAKGEEKLIRNRNKLKTARSLLEKQTTCTDQVLKEVLNKQLGIIHSGVSRILQTFQETSSVVNQRFSCLNKRQDGKTDSFDEEKTQASRGDGGLFTRQSSDEFQAYEPSPPLNQPQELKGIPPLNRFVTEELYPQLKISRGPCNRERGEEEMKTIIEEDNLAQSSLINSGYMKISKEL
eukprot:TRINITY_DN5265_c0_g2_i9.p1 TRINITY_DN5265_c0_g2~~TRINITY_DN5265_c0_g2_i9.p1  ORF type:complete len:334 (+),score=51.61 TRINITY_DN5265_c0_g2_i9:262-1263(+)